MSYDTNRAYTYDHIADTVMHMAGVVLFDMLLQACHVYGQLFMLWRSHAAIRHIQQAHVSILNYRAPTR